MKTLKQQMIDAILPIIMFEKVDDVREAFESLSQTIEGICEDPTNFVGIPAVDE
jgi:hypothetical protein